MESCFCFRESLPWISAPRGQPLPKGTRRWWTRRWERKQPDLDFIFLSTIFLWMPSEDRSTMKRDRDELLRRRASLVDHPLIFAPSEETKRE